MPTPPAFASIAARSGMPSPSEVFGLDLASASDSGSNGISKVGELLVDGVGHVNKMQTDADEMVHSMLTGGDVNEAEVLTAVQKADLAFRMMMQIRNKLMDAYREVQQIQI